MHFTIDATSFLPKAGLAGIALAASLLGIVVPLSPASADVIEVTGEAWAASPIDISLYTPRSVDAEVGALTFVGSDLNTSTNFNQRVWCIDLFHDIGIPSGPDYFDTSVGLSTNMNGPMDVGTPLLTSQINEMSWMIMYGDQVMAGGGNQNQAAAIQLAIWSLEFPTFTWDEAGHSGVNSVKHWFDIYRADASSWALNGKYANFITVMAGCDGIVPNCIQSFAYGGNDGLIPNVPVPEPASLALLGAGLLGLAGLSLRRRRRNGSAI